MSELYKLPSALTDKDFAKGLTEEYLASALKRHFDNKAGKNNVLLNHARGNHVPSGGWRGSTCLR